MTNGHSFDIIISYLGERETLREIVPPTNCPACNSELEFVNDQLFCLEYSCSAKSAKRLEHFAKTLKIKGLGPSTIDRLGLFDYDDIYSLIPRRNIIMLGFRETRYETTHRNSKFKECRPYNSITSFFDTADWLKCH